MGTRKLNKSLTLSGANTISCQWGFAIIFFKSVAESEEKQMYASLL